MTIIITGGAGFQGSHLAEHLLSKGHQISILNTHSDSALINLTKIKDKINIIWGSVTDPEIVGKSVRGHDVIFHMAALINVDESIKKPLIFYDVNVLGTMNVLEAIKANKNRLIYISTCEVYGDGHNLKKNELIAETTELRPNSPYAASKAAADRMCYAYFKTYGLDITIVRPFNLFGERQKSGLFGALIPILVSRALRGDDLLIFGEGKAMRDYTYISDIIKAYDLVLKSDSLKGKVINFASGKNTYIKDIVEYIAKKFNSKIMHVEPRPGEVMRFPADISFAKSLGFMPQIDIWEGIDRYIKWAKKNYNKNQR
jgi:dTDP-glucose 4,6-dehydratase